MEVVDLKPVEPNYIFDNSLMEVDLSYGTINIKECINNIECTIKKKINENIDEYEIWKKNMMEDSILKRTKNLQYCNFMFFCNLTIRDIYSQTEFFEFKKKTRELSFESVNLENLASSIINNINLPKDLTDEEFYQNFNANFINIIAFGKHLFYLLRYIIWLSRHKLYEREKLEEILLEKKQLIHLKPLHFFL